EVERGERVGPGHRRLVALDQQCDQRGDPATAAPADEHAGSATEVRDQRPGLVVSAGEARWRRGLVATAGRWIGARGWRVGVGRRGVVPGVRRLGHERHRRGSGSSDASHMIRYVSDKRDLGVGNFCPDTVWEWLSRAGTRDRTHLMTGNENGYLYSVPSLARTPPMMPKITATSQVANWSSPSSRPIRMSRPCGVTMPLQIRATNRTMARPPSGMKKLSAVLACSLTVGDWLPRAR